MERIEIQIARKFHKVYEKLAPEFGYTTRPETREFDENSSNGKLMIAVCKEVVLEELDKAREEGKLEVLEELLEWDTPLEPIGKFMRLQTKMVHMKKDLISKLTTK